MPQPVDEVPFVFRKGRQLVAWSAPLVLDVAPFVRAPLCRNFHVSKCAESVHVQRQGVVVIDLGFLPCCPRTSPSQLFYSRTTSRRRSSRWGRSAAPARASSPSPTARRTCRRPRRAAPPARPLPVPRRAAPVASVRALFWGRLGRVSFRVGRDLVSKYVARPGSRR